MLYRKIICVPRTIQITLMHPVRKKAPVRVTKQLARKLVENNGLWLDL